MPLSPALLVFIGGGLGSVARFAVSARTARYMGGDFPWGTLAVNLIGAFLIALIAEILAHKIPGSLSLRYFLITGVLGGFTTFSAFSLESSLMLTRGDYMSLALYVTASVVGTILIVAFTTQAFRAIF